MNYARINKEEIEERRKERDGEKEKSEGRNDSIIFLYPSIRLKGN